MKRIGILGGTFNPIHQGHLKIAREVRRRFHLARVIFVPCGIPPHKGQKDLIPAKHRLKMVKLAIAGTPYFVSSRIEIDRKGMSYAVDTLRELKEKYGEKTELLYILGVDAINELDTWREPKRLFDYARFLVVTRPGADLKYFRRQLEAGMLKPFQGKIDILKANIKLSSSEMRKKLRRGEEVRGLPTSVWQYIKKRKIYQEGKE